MYTAAAQNKVSHFGQFVRICVQAAATDHLYSEFVKANSNQGCIKSYFKEYPYLKKTPHILYKKELNFEPS